MNKEEGNKLLKACPICGSKVRIFIAPNRYYGVVCTKVGCIMMPGMYERSIEQLINDWNRRKGEDHETD